MNHSHSWKAGRQGITVLTLLLLIIALVIVAIFVVRYLSSRPSTALAPMANVVQASVA